MATTVVKRSGKTVKYNSKKIYAAIAGANKDAGKEMTPANISEVTLQIDILLRSASSVSIEEIQDLVEKNLMSAGFYDTAKAYIIYRKKHAERRDASMNLMGSYSDLLFADSKDMDLKRDNANINTDAPMGVMLKLGAEGAKCYADHYAIPDKFAQADKEDFIHIHDKDFSFITWNCLTQYLPDTLHGGYNTGHGFLREPNSIRSYAALACIAIQSSQNDMFGGQALAAWDFAMAEGIRKSFEKAYRKRLHDTIEYEFGVSIDEFIIQSSYMNYGNDLIGLTKSSLSSISSGDITLEMKKFAFEKACEDVETETLQAMEAAIHNFNSLHSRAGGQVPFSSINFGMDTSPEGQLAIRCTLQAIDNGLGNGETPLFPISIFQLKAGVNYNPGDPNYELFQKACAVSAKRLFPNFVNVDATYNLQYYKADDPRTHATTMGCRTRVVSNVNDEEVFTGRGNFAFTTINLPKLALEAKGDIKKFWKLFDKYIKLSKEYLEYRYEIIAKKHVFNFPFVMGENLWQGSKKLSHNDEVREALKNSSISIGFCGLAECLVALTGKHHGESADAQKLGLEIIGHLRDMTDKFTEETHMNWSTFATPAESTAGSFQRANQKTYGIIPGVTDREYMTNSSHVPVYYPIKAIDKIRIEAPYHELENAGHIAYVEMDGDPSKNLKAFESIVRAMHDANMGYFSINHPVDRDPICGYTGVIENECPHCHRHEDGNYKFVIDRLDR